MALSDEQIEEVFRLLHLGTAEQRQRFLGYLEALRFNERQQSYDATWGPGLCHGTMSEEPWLVPALSALE